MRKIEWAPLDVPLHRRIETLVAGSWMIMILFGELITLIAFLALLAFGNMYWRTACLLYCGWMYYDRGVGESGGRGQGYVAQIIIIITTTRRREEVEEISTFTFYVMLLFYHKHSELCLPCHSRLIKLIFLGRALLFILFSTLSWQWVRNLCGWRHFRNYFPITVHKTVDLPADRNYMMGLFPHGLLR